MSARVLLLLLFTAAIVAMPRPVLAQAACDRACLTSTLDQVLDAMVKHDPTLAPLATPFRNTENAEVVVPPEGVWKTASGLGSLQRRYVDPISGQAVYFGHFEEEGVQNIASLRIKVVDRKVTEGELVVGRKDDGVFDPAALAAAPPPQGPVAKEKRSSRQGLLADGPHIATGQYVVGNRAFATEVGHSLEFTGHLMVDEHNRFQVDAHVYASRFDNFIDLRPTGAEEEGTPVFQ